MIFFYKKCKQQSKNEQEWLLTKKASQSKENVSRVDGNLQKIEKALANYVVQVASLQKVIKNSYTQELQKKTINKPGTWFK